MDELTTGINWIAVVVSFVVSYMMGWLWYGPKMFGTTWAEGVGVDLEDCNEMPMMAMITQAMGTFALAWLVGITTANTALLTTILILAMLILLIVSNGKYAQKSNAAVCIEASYIVAMGIIMIICQATF